MRMPNKENEEIRQRILDLLKKETIPLSQPEIAKKLNIKQVKVWQMLSGMLVKNKIVSISKSQNPEQFRDRDKVAYLFAIKSAEIHGPAIREGEIDGNL